MAMLYRSAYEDAARVLPYKKGDVVNLRALLFNETRDFLIKYNTDQVVKAEQLDGKLIVLHFVLLDPDESWRWKNTAQLMEVYTELLSSFAHRPFEVVFVPLVDCITCDVSYEDMLRHRFNDVLSTMPWPAIPYSDTICLDCLAECFVVSEEEGRLPYSVAISPSGVVLQTNTLPLIRAYGAAAYPFTDERIACFESEDNEIRNRPSLEALLVSPERDYLITNTGYKVNVCHLEDKVVAFYLYEDGCTDDDLTALLEKAYRRLARENMNFEVVLIYIHDSPNTFGRTDVESFWKRFETMPWLALPYKDTNCLKVLRIFNYPIELGGEMPDPSLVIIGPRGEFVERLGANVLMKFGVQAYPFTRVKAYKLQVEKVKNLKLKMLFGREAVFLQCCNSSFQKVSFSNIDVRKTVIVFSEPGNALYWEFKIKLLQKYVERKGMSDEFEVIHIGGWYEEEGVPGEDLPWLRMAASLSWFAGAYKKAIRTFSETLLYKGYGVLVFDRDGNAVRATIRPERFEFEASDFPFCAGGLEEEVIHDLNHTCNIWTCL